MVASRLNPNQCVTCGQTFAPDDIVRELRRVTSVSDLTMSTDRYGLHSAFEHRVCPPPRTVTPEPARVLSDMRLTTPVDAAYYLPGDGRQIDIIEQSTEVQVSRMVRGPLGTRETKGIGWDDEKVIGERSSTRTTYVVVGAYPDLGTVWPSSSEAPDRTTIIVEDEGTWHFFSEEQDRH